MKINTIAAWALSAALSFSAHPVIAQQDQQTGTRKEINIGSRVLKQAGDNENSYKNEDYYYEKIWEVPGTAREVLYNRVLAWLQNTPDAVVSKVNQDEPGHSSIGASFELNIKGNRRHYMDRETVSFRWTFSFKDGKIRLQGSAYRYEGYYDHGMKTRQVATGYGMHNELYRDANEYDKPLHDLRPLTKGQMRSIYEDFDELYLKLVRAMKKNVLTDANSNW